jgi:hypothetical protein
LNEIGTRRDAEGRRRQLEKQWFSLVYVIFEKQPYRADDWEHGLNALLKCYVDLLPSDPMQPKFADVFVSESAKISSHVFDDPYFHDIFRMDEVATTDMSYVRVRIVEALIKALKINGYYRTAPNAPMAWISDKGPIRIFRLSCKNFEVKKDPNETGEGHESVRGLAIGVIYW